MKSYKFGSCYMLEHDGRSFIALTSYSIHRLSDTVKNIWSNNSKVIFWDRFEIRDKGGFICSGWDDHRGFKVTVNEKDKASISNRRKEGFFVDEVALLHHVFTWVSMTDQYLAFSSSWAIDVLIVDKVLFAFLGISVSKWQRDCLVVYDRINKIVKTIFKIDVPIIKIKMAPDNMTVAVATTSEILVFDIL